MANDLNYCSFIGRLGADVEQRFLPNGDAVAKFRIAVGWKGKDTEGAEWVTIVAFQKLAEICGEYLAKGSQVFVSGRMRTRKWQDQSGQDRYSTEIVADQMQMLGRPAGSDGNNGAEQDRGQQQRQQPQGQQRQAQQSNQRQQQGGGQQQRRQQQAPSNGFEDMDSDIPF